MKILIIIIASIVVGSLIGYVEFIEETRLKKYDGKGVALAVLIILIIALIATPIIARLTTFHY